MEIHDIEQFYEIRREDTDSFAEERADDDEGDVDGSAAHNQSVHPFPNAAASPSCRFHCCNLQKQKPTRTNPNTWIFVRVRRNGEGGVEIILLISIQLF